jgi:hypothetical protein
LNKGRVNTWFIKAAELDNSQWIATPDQFAKGSIDFDFVHKFANGTKEAGIALHAPMMQILLQSEVLIEEASRDSMKRIIGSFSDERAKMLFEADKHEAALAKAQNKTYERKYGTRTKYLVRILTDDFQNATERPMVLTLKGWNSVDMNNNIKTFETEMSNTFNMAFRDEDDSHMPMNQNRKTMGCCVFKPTIDLITKEGVDFDTDIAGIEKLTLPTYGSPDEALESLEAFTILAENWDAAAKEQEIYFDFINQHSMQDAAKLGGMYGLDKGVNLLPMPVETPGLPAATEVAEVEVLPNKKDSYGADSSF